MKRCLWAESHELMTAYHDEEWGQPSHDDRHLFELLTLEGAQAGLSWLTILKRREGYRAAFVGFDVEAVAAFTDRDVDRLAADASIIRNRAKIESAVTNARAILALGDSSVTLSDYVWSFVDGTPIVGGRRTFSDIPTETEQSRAMSRELKRKGFRFLGPTTCYAFMQAAGLVDDHVVDCFRYTASSAR